MYKFRSALFFGAAILAIFNSCGKETTPSAQSKNHLNIAATDDPLSLDPRLVRDLASSTAMRMLFEGLMRVNADGQLVPGVAEKVLVSEDGKIYTFTIRPNAAWSDGTLLTADDFEQTWKTVLSPDFPAPNAYQLYAIKNGKKVKEGRLPTEDLGVTAIDASTLQVELEEPTPYFLELAACHFYFPVSARMRAAPLTAPLTHPDTHVGNGPFKLSEWKPRNTFSVAKNLAYWDAAKVQLDHIALHILDENTSLQMFKSGQLHWAGSPLSTLPQDALTSLKNSGKLSIAPGAGTHWFRFNTQKPPFDKPEVRRAFSLALDRQAIVDHITQGNQLPAIGVIPPILGLDTVYGYSDHSVEEARRLFEKVLSENRMTREDLPKITLCYSANDRNQKIAQAVQQQWKEALGIDVILESSEGKIVIDKMHKGQYLMSLGSWYADINDPINFLEIFKSKENPTNQTFWENARYASLIEQSSIEQSPDKRKILLAKAEMVLLDFMPIAPLFHASYNYLKKPEVVGVYFSPLGYVDFKEASIESPKDLK